MVIDYQRPDLKWKPSLEYLAFTSGMSEAEAQTTLSRLQENGLISVQTAFEDRLDINLEGFYRAVEKLTLSGSRESLPDKPHDD